MRIGGARASRARDADRPVQRSSESAPWRTRISRPSTTRTPRRRAAARGRCRASRRRESTTMEYLDTSSAPSGKSLEGSHRSCRPADGAVDEQVGRPARRPRRARRASAASCLPARAACGSRPSTSAPGVAQRPDRGRGRSRPRRARARVAPAGDSGSAARSPGASVLSAAIAPVGAEGQRVRRADRPGALGRLVGQRERRLLVGDRHVGADEAGAGQRADGLGEELRRDRQPLVAPVASPSAASAALCIAGERLWATGQPRTPRRVDRYLDTSWATCRPRASRGLRCTSRRRPGTARRGEKHGGRRCRA